MKNYICILLTLIYISPASAKISEIYDIKHKRTLSLQQLNNTLPNNAHIILGEFHNTPSIQNAQAELISSKVNSENMSEDFSIHWEFLNHTDEKKITTTFDSLRENLITSKNALLGLTTENNLTYLPLFDLIKTLKGQFYGINIPRSVKQQVIKQGIGSIDQNLVPYHHYVGADLYFERFQAAMGGHAPAQTVKKYFLAQCLTDSVMADQILKKETNTSLNFTIAGSFHTDFYDGTVVRLKNLTKLPVITFKIIDKTSMELSEIQKLKESHKKFGIIADYLVLTK